MARGWKSTKNPPEFAGIAIENYVDVNETNLRRTRAGTMSNADVLLAEARRNIDEARQGETEGWRFADTGEGFSSAGVALQNAWRVERSIPDGPPWSVDDLAAIEADILAIPGRTNAQRDQLLDDARSGKKWSWRPRVPASGPPLVWRMQIEGAKHSAMWSYDASAVLERFARFCALDVIHLWNTPDVVVDYLKTGVGEREGIVAEIMNALNVVQKAEHFCCASRSEAVAVVTATALAAVVSAIKAAQMAVNTCLSLGSSYLLNNAAMASRFASDAVAWDVVGVVALNAVTPGRVKNTNIRPTDWASLLYINVDESGPNKSASWSPGWYAARDADREERSENLHYALLARQHEQGREAEAQEAGERLAKLAELPEDVDPDVGIDREV